MSIISLDGVPKTSPITYTGAGPLDDKAVIDKIDDFAKINTNLVIKGQTILCKEDAKEYIWTGAEWKFKSLTYVDTIAELENIDTTKVINGQELVCTATGGHYIYLPNISVETAPVGTAWYLREQLEYDKLYKIGCYKMIISISDLPYPVAPASATWQIVTSFDSKAPWVASGSTLGSSLDGSLPKIEGKVGSVMVDSSSTVYFNGCFYDNGVPRSRSWSGTSGNDVRSFGFKAQNSNSIYSASAGANVVRPTSFVVHIYQRTL